MYKTRAELDRRWNAKSYLCNGSEDKENANIWEPRARRLSGHTDSVYCLEFDSSRIITGSRDRTIKVWSVKTGRCLATITGHRGSVLCLKFDQDFDLDEANSLTEDGLQGWRKGFMVSGSSDTSVCVWDLYAHPSEGEDGEEMAIMAEMRGVLRGHTGGVLDLRISDKWIISCSKDTLIRVWNRSTLALHCTLKGHEGPVNAVGLQGNRVVSASGDGNMILWDITKGERLRTFEGHDRGLACIDFKDDYIVSGSNDCHDMLVRALSFDPRSGRLVSGSYDRTVKVWDMHTGKMIREFKTCHASHIFDVKFDCNRIVSDSLSTQTMKYFSTRGGGEVLSFEETVLTGLAPDGGLYIPESIPHLPEGWQTAWAHHSFVDLSVEILSLYISSSEISRKELRALVEKSYGTFRHPDVAPIKKLNDKTYILELFHGPTFAFKDVALQLLGNLFEFFLSRRNAKKAAGEKQEQLTVVGATSGDTGSAAIYGLRNKSNISIFILHPKGRVSPIQEAQMTTVTDANVHNLAVKGTFDDCQDIVKALFADKAFNAKHHLGAVNSINWARILAQTVYYFLSYFHLGRHLSSTLSPDELTNIKIQYVVPTGNFGDILAGYFAKRMGLPMVKLVIATNSNDILARFWKSGAYEKTDTSAEPAEGATAPAEGASDGKQGTAVGGVKETLSPAMDILVSSNFERLLWYLAYEALAESDAETRPGACETLNSWMQKVKTDGRVEVPTKSSNWLDEISWRSEYLMSSIRSYFEAEPSYVADPHTAVGLAAARRIALQNKPSTCK
ncbi:hypothetical protein EW026_g7675 [Hermanssonia centrifuga]|uniref:threonine synthase n=1 Tax=Hermanssonia centrifuga TaxID=98765 RepID=A0A4S4K6Z6_9APHY|nr:hypothetical protein EW026_g7675 [Hermanssonia centrifuga]